MGRQNPRWGRMSGLPVKETGSEFREIEILLGQDCLGAVAVSLFLGGREIP